MEMYNLSGQAMVPQPCSQVGVPDCDLISRKHSIRQQTSNVKGEEQTARKQK